MATASAAKIKVPIQMAIAHTIHFQIGSWTPP